MKSAWDFFGEYQGLVANGKYIEALNLLEKEGDNYPIYQRSFMYYKICLSAWLEDAQKTLAFLQMALDRGDFYPRMAFDPVDMPAIPDSIVGLPVFQQLLDSHDAGWQHIVNTSEIIYSHFVPDGLAKPPLVVAFHGNTSNITLEAPSYQPLTRHGFSVVMPQSTQPWAQDRFVWGDWQNTEKQVARIWQAIQTNYTFSTPIITAGLSKGGEVAVWSALSGTIPAQGVVTLDPGGPFIDNPDQWEPFVPSAKARGLAFYLTVAEQDYPNAKSTQAMVAFLQKHKMRYHLEIIKDLAHHQFPEDTTDYWAKALAYFSS